MEYRVGRAVLGLMFVVGVILGIDAVSSVSEAAVGGQQPPVAQEAESPYRNVEIFGGLPPDRLRFVMQVYSNVLGTNCEHCHVAGEWHLDDKTTNPHISPIGPEKAALFGIKRLSRTFHNPNGGGPYDDRV